MPFAAGKGEAVVLARKHHTKAPISKEKRL